MSNLQPVKILQKENLHLEVFDSTNKMGEAASIFVAKKLSSTLKDTGYANLILATGASQFTFLNALKKIKSIDWSHITVFHLDEYIGISDQHRASFRKYLKERILNDVKPGQMHFLNGEVSNIESEAARYENLLKAVDIHVACIGIGENGHIAFNDPPVADFSDSKLVKIVELDELCKRQQVGEGWFKTLDEVPKHALSLTIPAIMRCQTISCVVPDERKSDAVQKTINNPITTACPATILRRHPNTIMFLDTGSASKLK